MLFLTYVFPSKCVFVRKLAIIFCLVIGSSICNRTHNQVERPGNIPVAEIMWEILKRKFPERNFNSPLVNWLLLFVWDFLKCVCFLIGIIFYRRFLLENIILVFENIVVI